LTIIEGVDRLGVDEDRHLHEVALLVVFDDSRSWRSRLTDQTVVEVNTTSLSGK
jgi:hypothetical protein